MNNKRFKTLSFLNNMIKVKLKLLFLLNYYYLYILFNTINGS